MGVGPSINGALVPLWTDMPWNSGGGGRETSSKGYAHLPPPPIVNNRGFCKDSAQASLASSLSPVKKEMDREHFLRPMEIVFIN